jgi:hypothetical protein
MDDQALSETDEEVEPAAPGPDWWHRDHPTFAALTGFYTGLVFAIVVPGLYAAILAAVVGQQRAEDLFPFVLVTLIVPILLVIAHQTRRFGLYMWLGIVSTALVVLGVGGGVFWYMVSHG